MISTHGTKIAKDDIPHGTQDIPTCIMISPTVLNIRYGTQDILQVLVTFPTVLNSPTVLSTPLGTEHTLHRVFVTLVRSFLRAYSASQLSVLSTCITKAVFLLYVIFKKYTFIIVQFNHNDHASISSKVSSAKATKHYFSCQNR